MAINDPAAFLFKNVCFIMDNQILKELVTFGSIFFILTFWNFVVDWSLQTHQEAMNKATNHWIRFKHCLIYIGGLSPFVVITCSDILPALVIILTLFVTHFLIDTYIPVYLWAKYFREPPQMEPGGNKTDMQKFKDFASTPIGLFLVIAIDQCFHIISLIPVVLIIMWPYATMQICLFVIVPLIIILSLMNIIGFKKIYAIQKNR